MFLTYFNTSTYSFNFSCSIRRFGLQSLSESEPAKNAIFPIAGTVPPTTAPTILPKGLLPNKLPMNAPVTIPPRPSAELLAIFSCT